MALRRLSSLPRAVTQTAPLLSCANCSSTIFEREAKAAGWRYWSDGVDLHLICAACAARWFSADAPASTPLPSESDK